jgi:heme A synthase
VEAVPEQVLSTLLGGLLLIVFVVVAGALYFAPSIVASSGKSRNVGAVIVINLFLGWTLIGWVGALALALSGRTPLPTYYARPMPQTWSPRP